MGESTTRSRPRREWLLNTVWVRWYHPVASLECHQFHECASKISQDPSKSPTSSTPELWSCSGEVVPWRDFQRKPSTPSCHGQHHPHYQTVNKRVYDWFWNTSAHKLVSPNKSTQNARFHAETNQEGTCFLFAPFSNNIIFKRFSAHLTPLRPHQVFSIYLALFIICSKFKVLLWNYM